MINYEKYKEESFRQNPELKKEYESLNTEFSMIRALLDARLESGLTQRELAKRSGVAQGDISKIERGIGNPSIRTLKKLADAMGKDVQIQFVPKGQTVDE